MARRRTPIILLMGLRGSGKSALGRRLAQHTRRGFVDLDDLTPRVLGRDSVADAFRLDGEPAFREAEATALEQALAGPPTVIALGGGTPTAPGAAELMIEASARLAATSIYLRADTDTLRERLASTDNAHRPSLTGADVLEEIDALHRQRDPLYIMLADGVIDTTRLTEDEALELLLAVDESGVGCEE